MGDNFGPKVYVRLISESYKDWTSYKPLSYADDEHVTLQNKCLKYGQVLDYRLTSIR